MSYPSTGQVLRPTPDNPVTPEIPRLYNGDIIVRKVRNGYTVSVVHQGAVSMEYGDRYVTSDPAELARIIQQAVVTAALEGRS